MRKLVPSLLAITIVYGIALPTHAQNYNSLFESEYNTSKHFGLKFRMPLQGSNGVEPNLEMNFGYSFKGMNGHQAFVPVTGFDSSTGFHVLGVNKYSANDNGGSGYGKTIIYVIGGAAVLAGAYLLFGDNVVNAVEGNR